VLELLSGAGGCTSEARIGDDIGRIGVIGPDAIEGVVRRVGNAPFTRTIVDGGDGVVIDGPYEPELRRLAGAEVRITGRLVTEREFPGPTLEATSYEITSVDGERPSLGMLGRDEDGFYLEMRGREIARLGSVSEALAGSTGGLIWVILDANGGVARYGVLRDPL
jgi:hypothetical protein